MERIQIQRTFTVEPNTQGLLVRNNFEQLIADIVNATNEQNKAALARRIATTARQLGWTETELHALLSKKKDPTIRNFTAFVKWSIKVRAQQPQP